MRDRSAAIAPARTRAADGVLEIRREDGTSVRLLPAVTDLLDGAAAGKAMTVAPAGAMLTTGQAAKFLNASRPYLAGLLGYDEIPFTPVGSHGRVARACRACQPNGLRRPARCRTQCGTRRTHPSRAGVRCVLTAVADRPVVVLDANVLFPFRTREFLLRFRHADLFKMRWTERVSDGDEWMPNPLDKVLTGRGAA